MCLNLFLISWKYLKCDSMLKDSWIQIGVALKRLGAGLILLTDETTHQRSRSRLRIPGFLFRHVNSSSEDSAVGDLEFLMPDAVQGR